MLDNQINGNFTVKPKAMFDAIIQNTTGRGHSPLLSSLPAIAVQSRVILRYSYQASPTLRPTNFM